MNVMGEMKMAMNRRLEMIEQSILDVNFLAALEEKTSKERIRVLDEGASEPEHKLFTLGVMLESLEIAISELKEVIEDTEI